MLFVGLIIFGDRTAVAHRAVESAAADAARTSLTNQQLACVDINVAANTGDFGQPIGEKGTVEVTRRMPPGSPQIRRCPGSQAVESCMSPSLPRPIGIHNPHVTGEASARLIRSLGRDEQ